MRLYEALQPLFENASFNAWVRPDEQQLRLEYKVEYEIKSAAKSWTGNAWPTYEDFRQAAMNGREVTVNKSMDSRIGYRSSTNSQEELLSMIKNYASYPEFRNEQTLQEIYDGFRSNRRMKMPIVLEKSGQMRVFAGNTRMDIAFQLGINPKVLLISVD